MVLILGACGNSDDSGDNSDDTSPNEVEQDGDSEEGPSDVDESNSSGSGLAGLASHFESAGFDVGEKVEKAAAMIGAEDGFGLVLNNQMVEFYRFAPDAEEIKSIETNGSFEWEGVGTINAKNNGELVLITYEDHGDAERIVEVFKDY